MSAYLIDHPPVRDQFYKTRNRPLTGCTVLHTAESVMDAVGPDTGAEAVAEFIRTRIDPGSYHDLADSDSYINLVPYESGAYHDGTGSNNWALSISFACSTSDWRRMSPEKRAAFLANGARAFAAQQVWRKAHGYPTTELRLITKAQSDAGQSGFTYHGLRDPGRRSDPGVTAPNLFPFDEWLDHCRATLDGAPTQEDDMFDPDVDRKTIEECRRMLAVLLGAQPAAGPSEAGTLQKITATNQNAAEARRMLAVVLGAAEPAAGEHLVSGTSDPDALAAAIKTALGDDLAASVASRLTVTAS